MLYEDEAPPVLFIIPPCAAPDGSLTACRFIKRPKPRDGEAVVDEADTRGGKKEEVDDDEEEDAADAWNAGRGFPISSS